MAARSKKQVKKTMLKLSMAFSVFCTGLTGCTGVPASSAGICLTESMAWHPAVPDTECLEDSSRIIWNFGWESLRILSDEGRENAVIAPVSAVSLLSLLALGSDGQTRAEIEEALGANTDMIAEAGSAAPALQSLLPQGYTFAASMWINSMHADRVFESFCEKAKSVLGTDIYSQSFQNGIQSKIGSWIEKNTASMIESAPCEVRADDFMALVSTMLFKQRWKNGCNDADMQTGVFHNLDGTDTEAVFMLSNESMTIETEEFEGILKPCANENIVFAALLPKGEAAMDEILSAQDWESIAAAVREPEKQKTKVLLPVFESEMNSDLKPVLKGMGIQSAFEKNADFSNITDAPILAGRIGESSVVRIDQQGIKAAAADMAVFELISDHFQAEPEKQISFDRPFLYMIYVKGYEMPLVMGIQTKME